MQRGYKTNRICYVSEHYKRDINFFQYDINSSDNTGPSMKFDKIHSKEDLTCGLICIRFDNLTKFEHFEFVKIAKRRTILVSRESFWFVVSLIWQIQKCSNFVKLSKRMHIRPHDKSSFEWILSNFIDGPVVNNCLLYCVQYDCTSTRLILIKTGL